jgi:hypothetical protein
MRLTATETTIFVRQIARIHMVTTPGERGVWEWISRIGIRTSEFTLPRTPVDRPEALDLEIADRD